MKANIRVSGLSQTVVHGRSVEQCIDAPRWKGAGLALDLMAIDAHSPVGKDVVLLLNDAAAFLDRINKREGGGAECTATITKAVAHQAHVWYFG